MKKIIVLLALLFSFSMVFPQSGLPAKDLLNAAFVKAKKENKNVMAIFSSSWNGSCQFLRSVITGTNTKKYFEGSYIIVELYSNEFGEKKVSENPGTKKIITDYNVDTSKIPYVLILNAYGKKLDGKLVFLDETKGTRSFIRLIKKTSTLTDSELHMISERITVKQLSDYPKTY